VSAIKSDRQALRRNTLVGFDNALEADGLTPHGNSGNICIRPSQSASNFVSDDGKDEVSVEEVKGLLKAGSSMRMDVLEARWSAGFCKSPGQHGEEMLREQEAFDDEKRFMRDARTRDMRAHIARNIRARLQDEEKRGGMFSLKIQQGCMNIRKDLNRMTTTRRDFAAARQKMQAATADDVEGDEKKMDFTDLGAGFRTTSSK